LKIVVASHNPVKVRAVAKAFEAQFPGAELELISVNVASGVDDQPMSDGETRKGARNRVNNARLEHPDADFWVGQEGGLELVDGQLLASAWMAVAGRNMEISEARTPTLPLPPAVQKLVLGGMELGDANDRVFSTMNSKQGGGAFGLLTDGLLTRQGIYTQALVLALIPFVHELWS
jgi:inosine/xanthosine triphosphatase